MKNEQLENLKERLLKNPKFKKVYEGHDLAFEIGQKIFEARVASGWSQEKLAKKIGTKQPGIARIEGGAVIPSLATLQKIADALGVKLELPRFGAKSAATSYFSPAVASGVVE
jgi:ribosome-binding protein aMBF1 (putative translation factor)